MKNKTFKFKSSIDGNMNWQEMILEGDLGIRNSLSLKKFLHTVDICCENIKINLKNIEKLDITTIQNLIAFVKFQNTQKRSAQISADLNNEYNKLLRNTGFEQFFSFK
jgi:ABC-type transporter Mla MlaB component